MAIGLTFAYGAQPQWPSHGIMYLMILSYIVPVSLRINLDFSKSYYAYRISGDPEIRTCVVRNPNVCEELGRISYLLTDKTGTLTLNEMKFKKLKVGALTFDAKKVVTVLKETRKTAVVFYKQKIDKNKKISKIKKDLFIFWK